MAVPSIAFEYGRGMVLSVFSSKKSKLLTFEHPRRAAKVYRTRSGDMPDPRTRYPWEAAMKLRVSFYVVSYILAIASKLNGLSS